MLGIIGAMEEEVAKLKENMEDTEMKIIAGMEFNRGILRGTQAVVVRSGICKVNAAMCSQILADHYHVDAIINTGIAGSLRNEINIGDVVLLRMPFSTMWMPRHLIMFRDRSPGWTCSLSRLTES